MLICMILRNWKIVKRALSFEGTYPYLGFTSPTSLKNWGNPGNLLFEIFSWL